jgi:uncharacterized lipoprotein YmbA
VRKFIYLTSVALLLSGCIVFDKKSTAVTFHQFSAPTTAASKTTPVVFIPRAQIPAAVRRPTLVINDTSGKTVIDDSQRWLYNLDRAISDVVGHHLTQITGLPYSTTAPSDTHVILFLDVMQFGVNENATLLQLNYRIETSNGDTLTQGQGTWRCKRASSPKEFVDQQSTNLSSASAEISQALLQALSKSSP